MFSEKKDIEWLEDDFSSEENTEFYINKTANNDFEEERRKRREEWERNKSNSEKAISVEEIYAKLIEKKSIQDEEIPDVPPGFENLKDNTLEEELSNLRTFLDPQMVENVNIMEQLPNKDNNYFNESIQYNNINTSRDIYHNLLINHSVDNTRHENLYNAPSSMRIQQSMDPSPSGVYIHDLPLNQLYNNQNYYQSTMYIQRNILG